MVVLGVSEDGFITTAFPMAKAGAIFHEAMKRGKFQGVICPTTPTGSKSVKSKYGPATGIVCPRDTRMALA